MSQGDHSERDIVDERERPAEKPVEDGRRVAVEVLPPAAGEASPFLVDDGPRPMTYLELHAERRRRTYLLGGVGVASMGLALFLVIATGLSFWGTLFLIPGVLLLVMALVWKPYYWIYLPGFALAGFGIGWIVDDSLSPEPDVWLSWIGLGLGLLLAYLLRRGQGRRGHWLTPVLGVTLTTVGVLAGVDDRWQIVWKGWPLLIVAAGLGLVVRALLMGRREGGSSGGPPAVR
jgi:hypothetical protein